MKVTQDWPKSSSIISVSAAGRSWIQLLNSNPLFDNPYNARISMGFLEEDETPRRSLGTRDRQILYERAHHKCENCGKDLSFTEMQVGHKTAYSRGGSTTLKSVACLCYGCNKLQGTDSWEVFQRKQGKTVAIDRVRDILEGLTMQKLKYLASKHNIQLKGRFVEGGIFSDDYTQAPSKTRYVKELAKVVSEESIKSELSAMPATPTKKKPKPSSDAWSLF